MPAAPARWPSYLWSRVLFPAPADAPTAGRWPALLAVVLAPALLLWPAGGFHLFEPDEGRYAQIALELQANHNWLVPTLQGEPYLDKPPLFYWLVRLSLGLFGDSPAAARVVPALAVQLTVLAVYRLGRRSVGERGAFAAAMLLTVSPVYLSVARLLVLDGTLTLFITLSTLCAYEAVRTGQFLWRWWLLAAIASGLGFLTKGPISEVLLFPPLIAAARLSRGLARPSFLAGVAFLAVVGLVNLPWYLGMGWREPAFVAHFFWDHNVMRFARPFDHLEPVWYYVPIVLGGFLPGVIAGAIYLRGVAKGEPARTPAGGFWLLAGLWALFFFSCSGSKLPTYVMPAFPPLCLALGEMLARSGRLNRATTRVLFALAYLTMAALQFGFVPWYAKLRSPLREPARVLPYVSDPGVSVVTYPRHVDSVAVAARRADFVQIRSKEMNQLLVDCHFRPKTVVLFTHDHSFQSFAEALPPSLRIAEHVDYRRDTATGQVAGLTPWGLCDLAVVVPAVVESR